VDLFAELSHLTQALSTAGVDYALCGAVALAIHGAPRATKDIDVLAREGDLPRVRDVARAQGFDIEALPTTFSASGRRRSAGKRLRDSRRSWGRAAARLERDAPLSRDAPEGAALEGRHTRMSLTAEIVTARLRAMAEMSRREVPPMVRGVDMSAHGVSRRLREMADVSSLCERLVEVGRHLPR
jgi:hypothetical protein